ncbi:BQ5605_C030g10788 [Microbotryum silenes-dioicae]|uniref:BQ5605_C030g10788 protein n=1 Tax=Microbotryum silenes-dioicae TaxID=796604 RepID=A0A2X0MKM8_9BASI|nr:BQ5605_C030g10788 [Microbotryum silenes-dioicae]
MHFKNLAVLAVLVSSLVALGMAVPTSLGGDRGVSGGSLDQTCSH